MKSFSLLRTNVGLTTNVKVMCDSIYNLYLESIDSDPELSITRLKKMQFNKNNFYDELVPYFFKDFPSDVAYSIFYQNDNKNMTQDFSNQYDDLYQMGARNIINNKNYKEEYEYFAPLYVFKESFPKYFIIFRIDGPGLIELNSENFRTDFLEQFKTVKVFDLTKKTPLGEWIDRNFINNPIFPNSCLEIDFRNLEFSKWVGIDYLTGGFTYRSLFLENSLELENTVFDFEKYIFDGYKTNKIIFPQIINFSFLYDDTPATPTTLRKWSINRYSGFYIEDLELIDKITPFILPKLKGDVQILDENILYSPTGDPFELGYKDNEDMWVEYLGEFYKVEKFTVTSSKKFLSKTESKNPTKKLKEEKFSKTDINNTLTTNKGLKQETIKKEEYVTIKSTKYRIISDIDLSGKENTLNKRTCYVDSENRIVKIGGEAHQIDNINNADINLIEIDGKYHNISLVDGYLKLNTDYGFEYKDSYRFEYYINGSNSEYYSFIDLFITKLNSPSSFKIYRVKFTDVRDFDTNIIDTEFSKFEYEKVDTLIDTEEPKMFTTDLRIETNPANYNDYIYNNEVVNIPCSSDYTANLETFRVVNNDLTELWRKNPVHCRFGYQRSLAHSDYPYLLNNNDIHESFNKNCDTFNSTPNRSSRNLDYFYTINSGTSSYLHHTLHIDKNRNNQSFRFELDKYLNLYTYSVGTSSVKYSSDYFSYFFGGTQSFLDGDIIKSVNKYSYFDTGDSAVPNTTVFRGLKFKAFEVESLTKNDISVEDVNIKSSNIFNNYKFSILLSQNLQSVNSENQLYNTVTWGKFSNIQNELGYLAFRTVATQSGLSIGDIVTIYQDYPTTESTYSGISIVTKVGALTSGGYGFSTNKAIGATPSENSTDNTGYYKLNFIWKLIRNWETDVYYKTGDYVLHDSILYRVTQDHIQEDVSKDPSDLDDYYQLTTIKFPFWNPNLNYSKGEWCFRDDDYYVRNNVSESIGIDFWYDKKIYSSKNTVVKWKGKYYKSEKDNLIKVKPNLNKRLNNVSTKIDEFWKEVPRPQTWSSIDGFLEKNPIYSDEELWDKIPVWASDEIYYIDDYAVYNNTLYRCTIDGADFINEPGTTNGDLAWSRIYSFQPETNFIYKPSSNSIILIGESYYYCSFNNSLTLDSGINIYINKMWKNILVNIAINDNTLPFIEGYERDVLYNDTSSRITAANFIKQFNDLDSFYDFVDYTSYIVIETDGTIKKYNYDKNLENLPYILTCEEPDLFELKNDTLNYKVNTVSRTELKPIRYLVNGDIDNLDELNYYNEIPLGCEIDRNFNEKSFGANYGGRSNITISKDASVKPKSNSNISESFYRHSGNYMPIFYKIELFTQPGEYDTLYGNYKFDTNLSFFGTMRQRVISKVNRKENILKLRNQDDIDSIYPMLDEFGYTVIDFFIFKSTWDLNYHVECLQPKILTFEKPERMTMLQKFSSKEKISKK